MVDNIEFKRKASCDPWCHILFHGIRVVLVMTEAVGSTFLLVLEASSSDGQAQFAAIHHVQLSLRMKCAPNDCKRLKHIENQIQITCVRTELLLGYPFYCNEKPDILTL